MDADVVYRWHDTTFETEIRARSIQTSDADAFHLRSTSRSTSIGEPFFRRTWRESIRRRLV